MFLGSVSSRRSSRGPKDARGKRFTTPCGQGTIEALNSCRWSTAGPPNGIRTSKPAAASKTPPQAPISDRSQSGMGPSHPSATRKQRSGQNKKNKEHNQAETGFEEGSGNFLTGLGFDDSDELFARAKIGFHVYEILKRTSWRSARSRPCSALSSRKCPTS